ncbi:hypothetical protein C8R45DRAFT_938609 [Mycena sanguinolenta]|nr:hypothetical protein C8R45DRAFT_938609 [Mycena sanguinolenta]
MASTSPPAGPLSAADALLLNRYGHDTIRDVVGIISESVFCSAYGIFFPLAMYSIWSVLRNGLRSRRAIIMSLVVVYLYAASVTQWAGDSYTILKNIYCLYMTTDVALPDRAELADELFEKFAAAQETIFDLNCLRSLTLLAISLRDNSLRPLAVRRWELLRRDQCSVHCIDWMESVYRKVMKQLNTGGKYHGMSTENILSLLVESGLIYIALWIIQIIGYMDLEPYSPLYYFLQVLVGRTIWDERPITGDRTFPNSLRWAVNTNRSEATRKFNACPEVGIHLETVGEVMSGDKPPAKEI